MWVLRSDSDYHATIPAELTQFDGRARGGDVMGKFYSQNDALVSNDTVGMLASFRRQLKTHLFKQAFLI